jgi:hypothetical protein
MSDPDVTLISTKGKLMTTYTSLSDLQAEYDAMVRLAVESDYDLTPAFQAELTNLMRVVKELGGRV